MLNSFCSLVSPQPSPTPSLVHACKKSGYLPRWQLGARIPAGPHRAHPEAQEQGWGWTSTAAQPSCIRIRPWAPSPSDPTGFGLCPAPPGMATHLQWPELDSGCRQGQGWFFGGILAPTGLCNSAEVPSSKRRLQTSKQHGEGWNEALSDRK